jgi:IS30 family transposase
MNGPRRLIADLFLAILEGALIIGDGYRSALSVIIERQTRYVLMERLLSYATTVRKSTEKCSKATVPKPNKSNTCDQGKDMAEHGLFSKKKNEIELLDY